MAQAERLKAAARPVSSPVREAAPDGARPSATASNYRVRPGGRPNLSVAVARLGVIFIALAVLLLGGAFAWSNAGFPMQSAVEKLRDALRPVVITPAAPAATLDPAWQRPQQPAGELAQITPAAQDGESSTPPGGKPVVESGGPASTWTPTPQPTPTLAPTATPTPSPTPEPTTEPPPPGSPRPFGVGANERWIDVNLTTQTLVAYEGDIPVMTSLISSGTWAHPTVTGEYRTWAKYESQTMNGYLLGYDYYLPNVPYVMYFYRDYAIHGTYWHSNFGTPMSHGCVNMSPEEAGRLFEWAPLGTLVSVHY